MVRSSAQAARCLGAMQAGKFFGKVVRRSRRYEETLPKASARKTEAFLLHILVKEAFMENWIRSEVHQRRDEMFLVVSKARLHRLSRGEPENIRGRIADGALIMSVLLANFSQAVREKA